MASGMTCPSSCSEVFSCCGFPGSEASCIEPFLSGPSSDANRARRATPGYAPRRLGRETRAVNARIGHTTIVRGGLRLDFRARRAEAADLLITGDTITEIGAPGMPA